MASLADTVAEVATRLGLRNVPDRKLAYGTRDGYLVEVACGRDGNAECIVEIVRHGDPGRDGAVREALVRASEAGDGGLKRKKLTVENGVVMHKHPVVFFQRPGADAVAGELEALIRGASLASPAAPARCRLCGSDSGADPVLVNDVVDRVCPSCAERLQHEARQASARYDEAPMNLPLAVAAAAVLAVAGAVAWAGVAIATHRVFWLVAVGVGLAIGWTTTKAAGKGGRAVQVLGALATVVSMLLGELFLVAYHVQQQARRGGQQVDWVAFASDAPAILWDLGAEALFALGGGLIGAWYAARLAARPKIEVRVEKV